MQAFFHHVLALALAGLCACSSTTAATPAGSDAAAEVAAAVDAAADAAADAVADAATQAPDVAAEVVPAQDAAGGAKATPWGAISGTCGDLSASLSATTPVFVSNQWQFDAAGAFDPAPLRTGAKKRYEGPNAGGSSKCSEVMSMQLLFECAGWTTLKTETEVVYDTPGEIIDWLGQAGDQKVAVSVTRAYKGPTGTAFTADDAKTLLTKKLQGLIDAAAHVSAGDKWSRQIVHVWTLKPEWVPVLLASWQQLDAGLKANTLVLVTVEAGSTDVVADTCQKP